ncbi:hypothetical protein [Candidatus Amarobacter glycogenicus]|uniref:hypothetical protein n=1 Tax=Candidatus Amarobacter glycogenicus TaxID=3140699 RepID=UPI0031CC6858
MLAAERTVGSDQSLPRSPRPHILQRLAESLFQLGDMLAVVPDPHADELFEAEFASFAQSPPVEVPGPHHPQDAEARLALQREVPQQPLLPVAQPVSSRLPARPVQKMQHRRLLRQHAGDRCPHTEKFVIAEVRQDRPGVPLPAGRGIEREVVRLCYEVCQCGRRCR